MLRKHVNMNKHEFKPLPGITIPVSDRVLQNIVYSSDFRNQINTNDTYLSLCFTEWMKFRYNFGYKLFTKKELSSAKEDIYRPYTSCFPLSYKNMIIEHSLFSIITALHCHKKQTTTSFY